MCGRIAQFSTWQAYVDTLKLTVGASIASAEGRPRYKVGPGTRALMIDSSVHVKPRWWGYRPHWAIERKVPAMINARADKITGTAWKPLLRAGRVLVPADHWYEWLTGPDGKKQPYLLRPRDGQPLLLAALCNVKPDHADGPRDTEHVGSAMVDGMVIVTDASDQGMVDIHDRRPVALRPSDARLWLDPDTTLELAAELARTATRPVDEFEWYEVSRDVNRIGNDGPQLIEPITDDSGKDQT